jgi:hypothetical protein
MRWLFATAATIVVVAAAVHPAFRTPEGELSAAIALPLAIGLSLAVVAWAGRAAPRSVGWLTLALVGWSASLVLMDAPPEVAYQHLRVASPDPVRSIALVICAVQLLTVLTIGREHIAAIVRWSRSSFQPVMLVAVALLLIAPAAVPSRDPGFYLAELGLSTLLQLLALVALVAAGRSLPAQAWTALSGAASRILGPAGSAGPRRVDGWVLRLALAVTLIAAILARFVYEAHPHVPDEVAYLLHARYLAEGMLTMPIPPVPAGFNIDLMHYEPSRWFSPVPPGWPMVLGIGAWFGMPWLVNPVSGGIAVVLTYLLLGRITDGRETRLTTLLLASSPWFLFMSMNFMTHTLSLVCALAAALGVAVSRQNGSWLPAFAGGLAVGATSLVRPLEGLVTALLLGFWSLGARGRHFRLAPSAALVAGTLITGLLDRPYNKLLTGSANVFPIMAYVDKYHLPGSNDMGFGPNRGLGWSGLDPFPGHGAKDVVVNAALNTAQTNVELLGWPVGAVVLVSLALILRGAKPRRSDWWFLAAIAAVVGAHSFYYFSGGPDFGARYWYLIIVPCCALLARGIGRLDESIASTTSSPTMVRSVALLLMASTLLVYVPWRGIGKYRHYRGMRPDVRQLARQHEFGRSLVLVRGARHPDYASAAVYNPIDLHADAPIYAWDASPEIRAALLRAYPDRPVWILDGPSLTGGAYSVVAGPLAPEAALVTRIPPRAVGGAAYDPVSPPRRGVDP